MRCSLSEKGFTLFDVMQASTLSAVALVGLSSLLLSTIHATVRGRDITSAATLAEAKMEELRGLSFAAVGDGSDTVTNGETPYTRQWTVVAGPTASTKEVSVTVAWAGQRATAVELRTIIAE
jgi:Tfp pilus assembly protein PilV